MHCSRVESMQDIDTKIADDEPGALTRELRERERGLSLSCHFADSRALTRRFTSHGRTINKRF